MRKLIANFMLTRVGAGWVDESLPKETKDALDKSKRKGINNQLHALDFIDLASLLITPYSSLPTENLWKAIRQLRGGTTLTASDLQNYLPRSNWQRYFSTLVEYEDQQLEKLWKELYEYRCSVAHNALFDRNDYLRVVELTDELCGKLRDAITKLPQVNIPVGEQEVVAEEAAARMHPIIGEYVSAWKRLEVALSTRLSREHLEPEDNARNRYMAPYELVRRLAQKGVLEPEQLGNMQNLIHLRNSIFHDPEFVITADTLRQIIAQCLALSEFLEQ